MHVPARDENYLRSLTKTLKASNACAASANDHPLKSAKKQSSRNAETFKRPCPSTFTTDDHAIRVQHVCLAAP